MPPIPFSPPKRTLLHTFALALGAAVGVGTVTVAPAADAPVSFEKDVRPILKAHCFHCHGEGEKLKGGLDVRLRRLLVNGGDSGPAVVPGKPADSPLVQVVRDGSMPRGEKKLSPREVEVMERWVAQGAATLRPEPADLGSGPLITAEDRAHWAYQPVTRPAVPLVTAKDRVRTPIDAFLLAALEKKGLSLNPDADKRTLARRAYFDLLGLPPTPEEVEAFVEDPTPAAWEELIDQLLASPHYGERWGRHWLDVAGYADSEGYNDEDTPRDDAWRYRDYVIRSFNADKPFDRFIREQLAGDEMLTPPYRNLTPGQAETLAATGFLRMAPDGTGTRNDDPDEAKQAVVRETLKIVSSALLGLTVGCAECHDHRYDAIPQRDYYRLRAVFEPALDPKNWREPRRRQVSLLSGAERKRAAEVEAEAKKVEAELPAKLKEYRDWVFAEEVKALPDAVREKGKAAGLAFQTSPAKLAPDQKMLLDLYPGLRVSANAGILNLFLQKYGKGQELADAVAENGKRAGAVRAKKPAEGFIRALTEVPGQVPVTHLFLRGNRTTPGEAVPPGDLSVLTGTPLDFLADDPKLPTTGRRLALAKRLTDGTHPLTARVLVNRFWTHHFGRGLVNTPGDFGTQGETPTHPELLDWLASEFVRPAWGAPPGGAAAAWSLKRFHKLVMLSTAYRQSSARNAKAEAVDAGNALLWRMPVRRLEAEAVRDAILAVSGNLNRSLFGPPVPVTADMNSQMVVGTGTPSNDGQEFRRSVYVRHRRSAPAYVLKVFDDPQLDPNCEARTNSTVAPQSLVMMNSQFTVEQALTFAERVMKDAGTDPRKQAALAWRLAYGDAASDNDLRDLTHYLSTQTKLLTGRPAPKLAAPPTLVGKKTAPPAPPAKPADPTTLALATLCQVLFESNRFLYVD